MWDGLGDVSSEPRSAACRRHWAFRLRNDASAPKWLGSEHGYAYTVPLDLVSGIDAGEATYNEWARRYLRDVHDAPESSQELLSVWRGR